MTLFFVLFFNYLIYIELKFNHYGFYFEKMPNLWLLFSSSFVVVPLLFNNLLFLTDEVGQ